jgi:hypothetical protein
MKPAIVLAAFLLAAAPLIVPIAGTRAADAPAPVPERAAVPPRTALGYRLAVPPWAFEFPRDHARASRLPDGVVVLHRPPCRG